MGGTRPLGYISTLNGLGHNVASNQTTLGAAKQSASGDLETYRFPPGSYTPEQFVRELAPLLDSVLVQLGRDPPTASSSRTILIDGLRSCLSTDERESTLRLSKGVDSSKIPACEELAGQARKISALLLRYVQEVPPPDTASPRLFIRSPCEGHVWRPDAANLLFGPRSNGTVMQLYNEWLHQLVLLRDALLPFENFDEVQINLQSDAPQGLRPLENIRSHFLMQVMTAQIRQATLLDVGASLVAPGLPPTGHGLQFPGGSIMPLSSLTGGSSILLRYISATTQESHH